MVAAAALAGVLALPVTAEAGRAITGGCRTVFCAGISWDGSRVVFPFEEELTAGAGKRQIYERSGGKTRALLPLLTGYWPQLAEVSADATHVFVMTSHALAPEDVDGSGVDVFDVSAGRITLVSTGPLDGSSGAGLELFAGSSPDGQRTFFEAFGPMTPQDTDTCLDLYERSAGQTVLVAPSPAPPPEPPVCDGVRFGGVSADGTHLFFTSGAELEAGDERGEDIYQQVGSTFTRLTTYPEPESGCVDLVKFADASSDGGTVLFSTNVQVVAEDTDSAGDVYKRRPDGTFVLVSRGDGGSGQCGFDGDRPIALSADGTTAIFESVARLSPVDADSSNDLYSASDHGLVELISTGPTDANADGRANNIFPDWLALASDDARRVAFETHHPLVAADRDAAIDVYLRADGRTELISAGFGARPVGSNAELLALSADGGAVVFTTKEPLVAKDLDRDRDVYLRGSGEERSALLSAERIPPQMHIAKRGSILRFGGVGVRLSCPGSEASGPCHGRLVLKQGRKGPRLGGAGFRIESGEPERVRVRLQPRLRYAKLKTVLARARGVDALGNARVVTRKVRIGRG
jgi:hypothetical protein